MRNNLILLSTCGIEVMQEQVPIARHQGMLYRSDQFAAAVNHWAHTLGNESEQRYALFTQEAYPFAVLLFALLHAGKEVWIPGNNLPETGRQLHLERCRLLGDWPENPFEAELSITEALKSRLTALDMHASGIVFFTSGSSGKAKAVPKSLRQLQTEVETLESLWGGLLENSMMAGTVSHQHIYGLLFRVLWPLAAGRCFHSSMFLSPEALLAVCDASKTCWIASPGHLKRLDEHSPWRGIAGLSAIFSSGGPLPSEAAGQICEAGVSPVIEVYGSTETGGIAWRRASGRIDASWQPFENVRIEWIDDRPHLYSPYLQNHDGLPLDDRLTPLDDGRFLLLGRQDRIVKIEEKRLSLTAVEQRLQESPWIAEAFALLLVRHRDVVGVAAVLNDCGTARLQEQGRNTLIKHLRSTLAGSFEAVSLPRKWLFMNSLPQTAQGKVNQRQLTALMNTDTQNFPKVLAADINAASVRLKIGVPKELSYFPDHFPEFPLLPGVVQIGWAEHLGKIFFPVTAPFSHMEVIKFNKMIHPNDELELRLEWREASGKLVFQYSRGAESCSSGRLVYGDET